MKTMYLIRHGLVDNPREIFYPADAPLSERGTRQVRALAGEIQKAGIRPERVLASPHMRTRETAEILSQAVDGLVEFDERLVEWRVGDWIGKPLAEFRRAAGYDDPPPFHLKLEGIEPFDSVAARVRETVDELLGSLADEACAFVIGHREPMAAAILSWRGEPDWRNIPLLDIPRSCAWKILFDGDRFVSAEKAFDTSAVI